MTDEPLSALVVKLRRALRRAEDHARPVRGKDEVALRTSDWHAIGDLIRAIDTTPPDALAELAQAEGGGAR